jgi:hypothetical protein
LRVPANLCRSRISEEKSEALAEYIASKKKPLRSLDENFQVIRSIEQNVRIYSGIKERLLTLEIKFSVGQSDDCLLLYSYKRDPPSPHCTFQCAELG